MSQTAPDFGAPPALPVMPDAPWIPPAELDSMGDPVLDAGLEIDVIQTPEVPASAREPNRRKGKSQKKKDAARKSRRKNRGQ
jgi:hypothetical protein